MPGCALRYCTNNSKNTTKGKGITFHRFPRPSQETREKWIQFVQNNRSEDTWLPSEYSYICSLHFREEDKYITKTGRRFLKTSAVPYEDRLMSLCDGTTDPLSEDVSETELILDTPTIIVLKNKIQRLTCVKKKLTVKVKKVQRQNRYLKKKCDSLNLLGKYFRDKMNC